MKNWPLILLVLSAAYWPCSATTTVKKGPTVPVVPASMTTSPDYRIGIADVLAINVWKEPDISRTLPVRPDGFITLPLVGDVQAVGKTPTDLRNSLVVSLRKFIDDPQVTVIVVDVRSQRFNVLGEVEKPGTYSLTEGTGVLDAIALAGGLKEFAKKKKIYILRLEKGQRMRVPYNYKAVLSGRPSSHELLLQSGDTVVVP